MKNARHRSHAAGILGRNAGVPAGVFGIRRGGEFSGEALGEAFESGLQETGNFKTYEMQESPLNEAQEMELASEMLEVTNEQELDHFLGKLIGSIGGGLKKLAGSSLGRTLGAYLKPLAKKLLPIATGAVGTFLGGPLGGIAASQLSNVASKAFGLELEGMSSEDAQSGRSRRRRYLKSADRAAGCITRRCFTPSIRSKRCGGWTKN